MRRLRLSVGLLLRPVNERYKQRNRGKVPSKLKKTFYSPKNIYKEKELYQRISEKQ